MSAGEVAAFFHDTSGILKRYVQETGTAWVRALTLPTGGDTHFLAGITLPEAVAAITRRERGGHITAADAVTALTDFHYDFDHQYQVVEITGVLLKEAARLARTHALRGYDAVQLAAALTIHRLEPSLTLISADGDLNGAALAEGLAVENPNAHP